jgi:hypothetical protein
VVLGHDDFAHSIAEVVDKVDVFAVAHMPTGSRQLLVNEEPSSFFGLDWLVHVARCRGLGVASPASTLKPRSSRL